MSDVKYVRVLNFPGLSLCQSSEFSGFTYFRKCDRVLNDASRCNYGWALNIPGFQICQIFAYVSATQSSEYD